MWSIEKTVIQEALVYQYRILEGTRILSFLQVLELLKTEANFRRFYRNLLVNAPFSAFFWEHPPLYTSSLAREYEFVLYKSKNLEGINANPHAFQDYFRNDQMIVDFPNLRGDAHLIVPTPIDEETAYGHLAAFVRSAPDKQVDLLLQQIGTIALENLSNTKHWLSTAGLGVSWLHIRLDSRPKYYRYQAYKMK